MPYGITCCGRYKKTVSIWHLPNNLIIFADKNTDGYEKDYSIIVFALRVYAGVGANMD